MDAQTITRRICRLLALYALVRFVISLPNTAAESFAPLFSDMAFAGALLLSLALFGVNVGVRASIVLLLWYGADYLPPLVSKLPKVR